ncbi:tyrosine-protein phosphatase SIW14 [Plectosphaerella plurivora]|uniref:diphosphoinositol-polyphosphate diphosphatase n=1 Tax=Plectosphaerella plurivora TaxID=936078 RepID=A0A9P9ACH3_9PEZI|nr:tyrosine-protein phosphatase SIW14 [Plectosphaerella plurivora]
MASKRSGRTYQDEGQHTDVKDRRQSRPLKQEDGPRDERTDSKSSSSRGSRDSSTSPDTVADMSLNEKMVVSVEAKTSDAVPTSGRLPTFIDSELLLKMSSAPMVQYPVPAEGRPYNFGVVVPGVYRSSYPKPQDFSYMQKLGLKTVVTLGRKDEPDHEYADFMAATGIRHHIIDMKGTKKESIPIRTMKDILRIVLDQQHYPLMIHCNHGKHRTGCVVAVVRKVSGWKVDLILDEYRTYAAPKVRDCDLDYISSFELSQLSNLFVQEANTRFRTRTFYRATIFTCAVLVIWALTSRQITLPPTDGSL